MSKFRVLIVGGGVFGATGAVELARRGYGVTLIDPGPLPHPRASSTDVSKAIRMDYGADAFYTEFMEACLRGWDAWNEKWGERLYHEDGFLTLSPGAMSPGGFEYESHHMLTARGHVLERMNSGALKERFPAWAPEVYQDGYLNPRGGWAESGRVVENLLEEAQALGVEIRDNTRAVSLAEGEGRVEGVVTESNGTLHADRVVLAAGTWTQHLAPHLKDVMQTVGQPVFHFLPRDPSPFTAPNFPVWAADIHRSGWYGFPALPDGRVKVANHGPGIPVDPNQEHDVTAEHEAAFRAFLSQALPALADAPVALTRICFYCDTWDGDFYIDRDPSRPGLVVAAGGSGHGFKFAPELGALVADVVEENPNPWRRRFAWRPQGDPTHEAARNMDRR